MSMLPFHIQNTMLPESYIVGPNDVIIGRGKKCTLNPGNQRFREIVQTTLEYYSNAETKAKKSEIIMQVMTQVREGNGAGFVKQHSGTGRYLQVEEASCRIAIAQAFRDALSGTYKSSKKSKQIRRLERMRASESEESLAESALQGQRLFEEPSGTLRNRSEKANAAPWTTTVQTQEPFCAAPIGEPQSFTLFTSSFVPPSASGLTDAEPLPWCNFPTGQTFRPATSNLTSNSDLLASLLTSLGAPVCNVNAADPFEPTPMANQQAALPMYNHRAPSAA